MKLHFLLLGSLLFAGAQGAMAVKAYPGPVPYILPDGSEIEIVLHGDEHFNYATDPSGNLLISDAMGFYRPAPNNITVESLRKDALAAPRKRMARSTRSDSSLPGEPKYRYSSSAFPASGNPHSLVVLVEYPDYPFSMEDPNAYYQDFLNGDDFTAGGATGSCRQFYAENSSGAFVPTFDVYGPIMLKNNRVYYGGGDEANASQMVVEAVEALDDEVDFSQYDHNDDGFVDSIYLIYAHRGENSGGGRDSVWPYSWELVEEGVTLKADGVQFNTYGCSNELRTETDVDGIGTFTHEFGHVLGLPDLYNTYSADPSTPGEWSTMDNGSYNNNSNTPPNFSSFERYSLGWLAPEEIYTSGDYSLEFLADSNKAFILTTEENPDEFYMLEYRRIEGWDSYLHGHGMIVWHIDFNQEKWDENIVNNDYFHHYVDLVRADGTYGFQSFDSDPFPGSWNITQFANSTRPALKSWSNTDLNVTSLSNIREEADGKLHFTVTVTEERDPQAGVARPGISDDAFVVDGNCVTAGSSPVHVYDVSGRRVGTATADNPLYLSSGLYIVAGRKVLVP